MRSVIAVSLAAAVVAQTAPEAPSAVTVAPAAVTVAPAAVTVAPVAGANFAYANRGFNPYTVRQPVFANGVGMPYYGARSQFANRNPYALRAAPVADLMPAPTPAPFVPTGNHVDDYTDWRVAYLTAQAEKSESVMHSPLLDPTWNYAGTSPVDSTQAALLRDQYELQAAKGKMQAAEYMLNIASQNDAPLAELQEIKKLYDYERLKQMNIMVGSNPVMTYQIARQDYEWDANEAQGDIDAATNDFELRSAQLAMQEAQMDMMEALDPLMGGTGALVYPSKMSTLVSFMSNSNAAKSRQMSFDDAAGNYEQNPTAANMYEMQIAELQLEKAESKYMRSLAGFVSPLAALMNGNYRSSMNYKKQQVEAKIADLEEKLAAEKYRQRQGKMPFGHTGNLASEQKTQRAFFNLLTSGSTETTGN